MKIIFDNLKWVFVVISLLLRQSWPGKTRFLHFLHESLIHFCTLRNFNWSKCNSAEASSPFVSFFHVYASCRHVHFIDPKSSVVVLIWMISHSTNFTFIIQSYFMSARIFNSVCAALLVVAATLKWYSWISLMWSGDGCNVDWNALTCLFEIT